MRLQHSYKAILTRHPRGGRIEDACGGVTGHPYGITARLDPWRGRWLVGCALGLGCPAFCLLEVALGSFVVSSGVIRGHFRTRRGSFWHLWGLKVATRGSNVGNRGRVDPKDALEDQKYTYYPMGFDVF